MSDSGLPSQTDGTAAAGAAAALSRRRASVSASTRRDAGTPLAHFPHALVARLWGAHSPQPNSDPANPPSPYSLLSPCPAAMDATEYRRASAAVSRAIGRLETGTGASEIDGLLGEAAGALDELEREAHSAAERQQAARYRSDYTALAKDVARARDRQSLLGGGGGGGAGGAGGAGAAASSAMDRGTALLEQSLRVTAETEDVGVAIMGDMHGQREQLVDAHDRVKETRQFTRDAHRIMRAMGRREVVHKVMLVSTILILLVAIGLVTYYLYIKPRHR